MRTIYTYSMWVIQLACLITILVASWQVLDRNVFAILAASLVLLVTLYVERVTPEEEP